MDKAMRKRILLFAMAILFITIRTTGAASAFGDFTKQIQAIHIETKANKAAIKAKADEDKAKRAQQEKEAAERRNRLAEAKKLEEYKTIAETQLRLAQRNLDQAEKAHTASELALADAKGKVHLADIQLKEVEFREKSLQGKVGRQNLWIAVLGLLLPPISGTLGWLLQRKEKRTAIEKLDLEIDQLKQQISGREIKPRQSKATTMP
jgi:hypothetical protein